MDQRTQGDYDPESEEKIQLLEKTVNE